MGPYLFVFLIVLILTGFISWWFPAVRWIYSGLGVLLFSAYLVMDVQMVVGGKHRKHVFSVDDYIFAALTIYIE
jgi:FtsH-binding integral membrane protein